MSGKYDDIKKELKALVVEGDVLTDVLYLETMPDALSKEQTENAKNHRIKFHEKYQSWYIKASEIVGLLTPDRLHEFKKYYYDEKRGETFYAETYNVRDYILGRNPDRNRTEHYQGLINLYITQVQMLEAASEKLDSNLFNIKSIVQYDLFDSEIEIANELLKSGILRAAGAIAGVVLDNHLKELCSKHGVSIKKSKPNLGDYNKALHDAGIFDMPTNRRVQHLSEIRALATHTKDREPTKEEIEHMVRDVDAIIKTLF